MWDIWSQLGQVEGLAEIGSIVGDPSAKWADLRHAQQLAQQTRHGG